MYAYVDECGCASIFGPLAVCAVAVEKDTKPIKGVADSKQLSKSRREKLYPILTKELNYSIKTSSVQRIAEINLHWAKLEAMKNAINELAEQFDVEKVIVDGKFEIPDLNIPQEAIIKADSLCWQVSAASIIGKVYRDNFIAKLGREYENYSYYDLENNAGYFSPTHRDGIILHGPSDLHRKGFVYFQYCLSRHKQFVQSGKDPKDFLKEIYSVSSDYQIWKNSKKDFMKPILQEQK